MNNKRLTGAQFVASVAVTFVLWCACWKWFCETWVSVAAPRWGDWLPPALIDFFYPWELVVAPFLDGLILYSIIFFYLKLLNYPEGLSKDEVDQWRHRLYVRYLKILAGCEFLYLTYLGLSRALEASP